MQQIYHAREEAGDTEKQKTLCPLHVLGVPSEDENRAGNGCAECLGEGVKEEIIMQADQMQAQHDTQQGSAGRRQRMSRKNMRSGVHVPEQE